MEQQSAFAEGLLERWLAAPGDLDDFIFYGAEAPANSSSER